VTVLGDWPTYLLRNIPPEVRKAIERDESEGSMQEVMRQILCSHYSLDCENVLTRNKFLKVNGTPTMVLRLQPELFQAIRLDAQRRKVPARTVIIEALERHYAVT
jgi:EAL domain-containing protein (putative c-di-GMP-specific phosphodiesterase class I)